MKVSYPCVDRILSRCERYCNPVDAIPYISAYSGLVRIGAGMVEMAAGAALALIKVMHALLKDSCDVFQDSWKGISYSIHGAANVTRGTIAVFPWFNLLLPIYDYKIGRFNYLFEIVHPDVYPLNQDYI